MRFRNAFGYELDLNNPKTYNEKLQWLKLNDRNPLYTTLVDKYEVKKYVGNIIGEKYIIKTLGVYDRFNQIEFEKLPKQFVIKSTHDSGGIVICKDKSKLDKKRAKRKIEKSLKTNYYFRTREWPYKNVKPRIIVEEYISSEEDDKLRDYKFYCFNGKVKAMFIASDRENTLKLDFFDENFNFLPFSWEHPNSKNKPSKPKEFEKMKELAEKIAQN